MDTTQRIAQFENMVQADPENDMAHFSLGGAYAQAGRHAEAAEAYERCIARNRDMSKAYQLAGQAWIATGELARAKAILLEGHRVSGARGDWMPRKAIASMLEQIGAPVPKDDAPEPAAGAPPAGGFVCARTGRPGTKLARPPFRGPIGAWIGEHISQETWNQWVGQGTKVINELRLDLSRDEDAEAYDRHMREFLGIDADVLREIGAA